MREIINLVAPMTIAVIREFITNSTIFPKIGQRMNRQEISITTFYSSNIRKDDWVDVTFADIDDLRSRQSTPTPSRRGTQDPNNGGGGGSQ